MILRNLLRRKTRTLLTLIGIAIGVAAVVALGAIAEGFVNSYTTILTSSGADLILVQGDAADILYSAVDESVGPQVMSVAGVTQVAGVLLGLISTPDVPYFIVYGVPPNTFAIRHYRVVEGQTLTAPRQVLLGRSASRTFKKKVRDYIKIQGVSYQIVGIYETGQTIEDMGAVIALKDAQEVLKKPGQVAYYQIKLERPQLTTGVTKELERRFPKLTASRSASYMDNQQETQMLRAMSWFIGLLAVLAGGLVMMNTMLMSVFERTREIGVLRALGWRSGRVLRLILGEAFLLSLVGGVIGILAGVGLVSLLNQLPVMAGFLENAFSPTLFIQAMAIALLLGAAGGFYPAWRASRLQPVEAMRYEGGAGQLQSRRNSRAAHPGSPLACLQRWQVRPGGIAFRNLVRQRTRTLLTTLAIGVGVGLVVALGGIGQGLLDQLSAIGKQTGDLTIVEAKASDISLAAIDDKVGRYAASLAAVENVSGLLIGIASVPGTPYFLALGVDPGSFLSRHFVISEGTRMRIPREVILGRVAAKNLNKHVGDNLSLMGSNYRVVGIFETGISYEDSSAVMSLQEAQRLFRRPNQVSAYGLKLRDPSQAEVVRRLIETRWPQVSVSQSTEFAERSNDMQSFRMMTNALSLISVLVGGVGIMNAMLMSVYERTREIGTLRALGWRRRRVIWMIVRESLMLSFLSGLAGIVIGVLISTLIGMERSMGSYLQSSFSLELFAQAMLLALTLGAIGALYPAWRASSLSPIEALRYE